MDKKDLQQALPRFAEFVQRFGPLLEDGGRAHDRRLFPSRSRCSPGPRGRRCELRWRPNR